MKTFKSILSGFVIFLFGLEVGGFGMWYIAMTAIQSDKSNRKRKHVSYRQMADHRYT